MSERPRRSSRNAPKLFNAAQKIEQISLSTKRRLLDAGNGPAAKKPHVIATHTLRSSRESKENSPPRLVHESRARTLSPKSVDSALDSRSVTPVPSSYISSSAEPDSDSGIAVTQHTATSAPGKPSMPELEHFRGRRYFSLPKGSKFASGQPAAGRPKKFIRRNVRSEGSQTKNRDRWVSKPNMIYNIPFGKREVLKREIKKALEMACAAYLQYIGPYVRIEDLQEAEISYESQAAETPPAKEISTTKICVHDVFEPNEHYDNDTDQNGIEKPLGNEDKDMYGRNYREKVDLYSNAGVSPSVDENARPKETVHAQAPFTGSEKTPVTNDPPKIPEPPQNPILVQILRKFCSNFTESGLCKCEGSACVKRLIDIPVNKYKQKFKAMSPAGLKELFNFCKTSFPFFNKFFPALSEVMGTKNLFIELISAIRVCETPLFHISHYKWVVNGLIRADTTPKFAIQTLLEKRKLKTPDAMKVILEIIVANRLLADFKDVITECVNTDGFFFDNNLADQVIYFLMTTSGTSAIELCAKIVNDRMREESRQQLRPEILMWVQDEKENVERPFRPPTNLVFKDFM